MLEDVIKDMQMKHHFIEVRMKRIKDIHEYHLQRILHDERCIGIMHDKRSKSKLLYDVTQGQSLKEYLCIQTLDEVSFLNLLLAVFETILGLNADKIVYCHIEYIYLHKENGQIKALCIPMDKTDWNMNEADMAQLVRHIIQYAQVENGYEVFGCMIQQLKKQPFQLIQLLQELTQRLPEEEPKYFFEKWFHKEETRLPYPLPVMSMHGNDQAAEALIPQCKEKKRQRYVEDIVEETDDDATVVLFQEETAAAYLRDEKEHTISITDTPFVIGRQHTCDYVMLSSTVSKKHASIMQEEDGYYLVDLGSSNHTMLNGVFLKPQKPYHLNDQDEILIADERISFHE